MATRSTWKHRLTNAALAFASIALVLLLLEGLFRLTGVGDRLRSGSADAHEFHARLGWVKVPGSRIEHESREFSVVQTTNARGLRGPVRAIPKPAGTRRVLLLGDSFTLGRGVDDDSVVSSFLERRLERSAAIAGPVEVVNGGTTGYSTDQELVFFREQGVRYEPDVTVLLVYLNDISQNVRADYRGDPKPHFRLGPSGELTFVPAVRATEDPSATGPSVGWPRRLGAWLALRSNLYRWVRARTFAPGAPLYRFAPGSHHGRTPIEWAALQTEPDSFMVEAWRITEALLARMRADVEAAGSRFVVFYAPSIFAVRAPQWALMQERYGLDADAYHPTRDAEELRDICSRLELACVVEAEAFRRADAGAEPPGLYYTLDEHWTPRGHALAAELIADAVEPLLAGR